MECDGSTSIYSTKVYVGPPRDGTKRTLAAYGINVRQNTGQTYIQTDRQTDRQTPDRCFMFAALQSASVTSRVKTARDIVMFNSIILTR